ncbi:MAG: choice-of-anchor J domain-containing protein [Hyphomicrobiales bacterium]
MKRNYILLLLLLLGIGTNAQVVFYDDFESNTQEDVLPVGWEGIGEKWTAQKISGKHHQPYEGDYCAVAEYNSNEWLYRSFNAEADALYEISFWYKTNGKFKLRVCVGADKTPEAMTTELIKYDKVEFDAYTKISYKFRLDEAKEMYLGLHVEAGFAGANYLMVDNIKLKKLIPFAFTATKLTEDIKVYSNFHADHKASIKNPNKEEDTYSLAISGNNWDAKILDAKTLTEITELTVGSDKIKEVIIRCTPPMNGIKDQDTDKVTLTITSKKDAQNKNSLDFTTIAIANITDLPYKEGFEEAEFPYFNWVQIINENTSGFTQVTEGKLPETEPHDNSNGMLSLNFFTMAKGRIATLFTPPINRKEKLELKLWVYRTNDIPERNDVVNIYANGTPTKENATKIGSIHRLITSEPVEQENDWYEYSFKYNPDTDQTFFIIEGVSDYGWNLYLDDIQIKASSDKDLEAPEFISVSNNTVYADEKMDLSIKVRDESEVPETIKADLKIGDNTSEVELALKKTRATYYYEITLDEQRDGTTATLTFTLTDVLNNSLEKTIDLKWEGIRPVLYESFEGDEFPPKGWTSHGQQNTYNNWAAWGKLGWADDSDEFTVTPWHGKKQASVEADLTLATQNERLITPEVNYTGQAFLSFMTCVKLGSASDNYEISASTDDGSSWTSIWNASKQEEGRNLYEKRVAIDISGFADQPVKFSFHAYNSIDPNIWYSWFIDDVKIDGTTNVNTITAENLDIKLAPNPTENNATLVFDNKNINITSVSVVDIMGKTVWNNNTANNSTINLPVQNLNQGIYFCKVITNKGHKVIKFIKK